MLLAQSSQDDGHEVVCAESLAARRTLSRSVRDQVLDADIAEDVAAELECGVAKIGIAHGANSDSLRHSG